MTTSPIGEILTPDDVLLDIDAETRDALLRAAASLLEKRCHRARTEIFDALTAREQLGSTALGHGVALPHARLTGLQRPVAAFLRTRAPIAFDAPDARPVNVFLALLVPKEASEQHLAMMACAARQFSDRDVRMRLKTLEDRQQIADVFANMPERNAS
ncbi:MAG TPA: PTS sugar transporter subunit IIA [Thermoanaerobaculia bacterium]|nr:PTS sugar transporter subunit IIA [Thermoanaerobaculia bacterium]